MSTAVLGPEVENHLLYHDASDYNPALYPTIEVLSSARKYSDSLTQLGAHVGRYMLRGFELLGTPRQITDAIEANIDALAVISERGSRDYDKPDYGIDAAEIDGKTIQVQEEVVQGLEAPFGRLLHFKKEIDKDEPPALLVAPMSGHYSTILRDTAHRLLQDSDVYITDWANARDVPTDEWEFDLNDYVDYLTGYIKELGPESHVVAVCQATVPAIAAVSYLAQTEPSAQPKSMTLMAGPLDTSKAETKVTKFADSHDIEWFQSNVTAKVPDKYSGGGRLVYPGFMQLASFMGMNINTHVRSHRKLMSHLIDGNAADAKKLTDFYDEYFSVADMSRPFYLQTVDEVFKRQTLANKEMLHRGIVVDPAEITKTAILTIEAANDDISAPGQTLAAHEWLRGLKASKKKHHIQPGIGHYGVFSGSTWRNQIAPVIASFMYKNAR